MTLYEDWQALAQQERTQEEYDAYWSAYFEKETEAYKRILSEKIDKLSGTLAEISDRLALTPVETAGFFDGINTSLIEEVNLDALDPETNICAQIDFEKLYYNMLKAKAPWLYGLTEWDGVLPEERRHAITKQFKGDQIFHAEKVVSRNDPCPCGSGKKYKKCCGAAK